MINSIDSESHQKRIDEITEAVDSDEVVKIYANGFVNAFNPSDVILLLKRNNKPQLLVNMSYTVAKTLGEKLLRLIKHLEEQTGNEIMTTDYIDNRLKTSIKD